MEVKIHQTKLTRKYEIEIKGESHTLMNALKAAFWRIKQ